MDAVITRDSKIGSGFGLNFLSWNNMNDSFWARGSKALLKEIHKRYQPILKELKRRHKAASLEERHQLKVDIERTKTELQKEIDEAGTSLF